MNETLTDKHAIIGGVSNPQLGMQINHFQQADGTDIEVHSGDALGQTASIVTRLDGSKTAVLMLYTPVLPKGHSIGIHWTMNANEAIETAGVLLRIADMLNGATGEVQ